MNSTGRQYEQCINTCKEIFIKKTIDYGTSWTVLRPISIIDQLFIKAQRIRTIQEKGSKKVADDIKGEFVGMVNYSIIGLIQLERIHQESDELATDQVQSDYDRLMQMARETMEAKNHDYGEAWRDMSQQSFVDLILMKLMRMKQILQNNGKTLISEGMDANYIDIINYSLFGLILINEGKHEG